MPRQPSKPAATRKPLKPDADGVVLLSGGNPQIAKGYGDAPVQAWIKAAPGWKGETVSKIDALVSKAVPGVMKAVKWNSPLYGVEEGRYFLGLHAMTKYIKLGFYRGASLVPPPPGKSKQEHVRYLDIYEGGFDETQVVDWVKQAAKLPGEKM